MPASTAVQKLFSDPVATAYSIHRTEIVLLLPVLVLSIKHTPVVGFYVQVGGMSCRVITPWSEGPDPDFLAMLSADFNTQLTPKSRDSVSKKAKAKRRQSRTKSTSEEAPPSGGGKPSQATLMAERQVSVSSDVSARSEEDAEMEAAVVETGPEVVSCVKICFIHACFLSFICILISLHSLFV